MSISAEFPCISPTKWPAELLKPNCDFLAADVRRRLRANFSDEGEAESMVDAASVRLRYRRRRLPPET